VHELYSGEAAPLIEAAFPNTTSDGTVDRTKLSEYVIGKPENMKKLEAIIHPLVHKQEQEFLKQAETRGDKLVVLDIPLLFETGGKNRVDKIIVVTAPAEVQRERVLARDGMSVEKFEAILARQVPDREKREQADFVIDTSLGLEAANITVREIIKSLI
jgi:dephospho-CoA kinase